MDWDFICLVAGWTFFASLTIFMLVLGMTWTWPLLPKLAMITPSGFLVLLSLGMLGWCERKRRIEKIEYEKMYYN